MRRVALVTGGARGIGAAVVAQLAAEGYDVAAVDVCADEPALHYALAGKDDLERSVAAAPDRIHPFHADVRDPVALAEVVDEVERRLGGLDVVVAAAGAIAGGDPLWDTATEQFDVLFDINVRGVYNLARATVPALLRRPVPRHGRFVALASAAAHTGLWHLAAYCGAKHAVVGLVKGLATDLRDTGVTAVSVSPGATETAMLHATAVVYGLESIDGLSDGHLVGRVLQPSEVAAVVAWLCSPLSAAVTGTVVHADGGFSV